MCGLDFLKSVGTLGLLHASVGTRSGRRWSVALHGTEEKKGRTEVWRGEVGVRERSQGCWPEMSP